jgi:hypothetical protein
MSDDQQVEGKARGKVIIAWVVAPMVVFAFFPTVLLMVIGLAPSIVAFIIDKRPGKVTARAIGYLNLAGCLPYAIKLWTGQNTITGVLSLVGEPSALMVMYSSAAVGWMLNFIMTPIMTAYLAVQHEVKLRSIGNRQKQLIKEWGGDVKGQATIRYDNDSQRVNAEGDLDEGVKETADLDDETEDD